MNDVPPGWVGASPSTRPLVLLNAYAFSKSSTPLPDQWTYFAKLRPVPWSLVGVFAVIAFFCAWGLIFILSQLDQFDGNLIVLFPLVLLAAGALFFGSAVIKSVLSYRSRAGWPHLHGIGLGTSGIAFRLTGGDSDVPWDAVTSIEATFVNSNNRVTPAIPVLRIEYAGATIDVNTQILGASPLQLYWALVFYWENPADRDELDSTKARDRMASWMPRGSIVPPIG